MTRIKSFKIANYKGIYPEIEIELTNNCKNLVIYGENGSGKTSIVDALFTFFESSENDIKQKLQENKNIYTSNSPKIEIHLDQSSGKSYIIEDHNSKITDSDISTIFKTKSFLSYKDLIKTYSAEKTNLFELLLGDILKSILIPPQNTYTYGEALETIKEYDKISNLKKLKTQQLQTKEKEILESYFKSGKPTQLFKDLESKYNKAIDDIEISLKQVFSVIQPDIAIFLSDFSYDFNFDFDLSFIQNRQIFVKISFNNQDIEKPNGFFNEAKLTAMAISIYFAVLKNYNPSTSKFLFLDDILIGMDLGHRLPILKILEEYFTDYQTFLLTYDKFWFDVIKQRLGESNWKYYSLRECKDCSIIYEDDFIAKSEEHLHNGDYKASAAYLRTEFERILHKYSNNKRLPIRFREKPKDYTTDDFWVEVKKEPVISSIIKDVELARTNVLNNFVHLTSKPKFKKELQEALKAIKELKRLLGV